MENEIDEDNQNLERKKLTNSSNDQDIIFEHRSLIWDVLETSLKNITIIHLIKEVVLVSCFIYFIFTFNYIDLKFTNQYG